MAMVESTLSLSAIRCLANGAQLRGDPSYRQAGLRLKDLERFAYGLADLDHGKAVDWAYAWRASLKHAGAGRIRHHMTMPGKHDGYSIEDAADAVRFLVGGQVHRTTLRSMSWAEFGAQTHVLSGPTGDYVRVSSLCAYGVSALFPESDDLWVATGLGADCHPEWADDPDTATDHLVDGILPTGQAGLQARIDMAAAQDEGDRLEEERRQHDAPSLDILARAWPMALFDAVPPKLGMCDFLVEEPGLHPGIRHDIGQAILGGNIHGPGRMAYLRLPGGMTCEDAVETVDALLPQDWALAAVGEDSGDPWVGAVLYRKGAYTAEFVSLLGPKVGASAQGRFDTMPDVPLLHPSLRRFLVGGARRPTPDRMDEQVWASRREVLDSLRSVSLGHRPGP